MDSLAVEFYSGEILVSYEQGFPVEFLTVHDHPKALELQYKKKNVKNQANTEMLNKRRFVHTKNVVKDANYLTSCKCLLNNTFLVAPENLKVNQK